ncbi:MAG: YggS family pyridoxal phosphate-dependent enzyme [Bacteroidales bacterium]|nr:YggS family pyridoxal phosphate-dependent enzyme [Bacteroidales bacterium]
MQKNIYQIQNSIPNTVKLIAVSKTKPIEDLEEAYAVGVRDFGENKVQELIGKYEALPKDIRWHFIGHLQTNKVKMIAPFVHLIHSVDSLKLLKEIDKEAQKNNRVIDCLLEFFIAEEDTKFGLDLQEAEEILSDVGTNVRICGVMGMATFTDDKAQIRREFNTLHGIFQTLKEKYFTDKLYFKEISMGMSDDFPIAIEEGSTMIRVGSTIFGKRKVNEKI